MSMRRTTACSSRWSSWAPWSRPASRRRSIHFVDDPAREPALCRFARAGLAICRRAMGRAERGDCLFHLATAMATPD